MEKFCDHHRDHRHNIEQFRNLRYLLESMVRARRLKEFIKQEDRHPKETEFKALDNPLPVIVEIFSSKPRRVTHQESMSRGLVAIVQYSFTAASTWPIDGVISLSDQDNRELDHPHEDTLVLALEIESFLLRRVLVYTESAVDIMHQSVLV